MDTHHIPVPSPASSDSTSWLASPRKVWTILLALFLAVYFAALFTPHLIDDADSTHANAAQHMARTGDWVTLYVNGIRYLEKGPLPYWFAAIDYRIFGYNAFATHLPQILAVLGCTILAWAWGRRAFGDRAGFYAGVAMLTSVGVFIYTRFFIPESILTFFLSLALWAFFTGLEDRKPNRFYITYAALAVGLLAKGLIAPVFFLAAAVPYLLITGDWRRWREFRLFSGILLFLAIGAPWHVIAALRNPDHGNPIGNHPTPGHVHGFLYFYFWNEHVLRFLGKRYPHDWNKQPGWIFWVGQLAWLFPWTLFVPAAVARLWQNRRNFVESISTNRANTLTFLDRHATAHDAALEARQLRFRARTTLLLGIYTAFILVFFSISTNQEYYTWPIYLPLLVLLTGSLATTEESTEVNAVAKANPIVARGIAARMRWVSGAQWFLFIVGFLCSAALGYGLWASHNLPYVADVGTLMAHRGVGDYSLSTSHLFDLTGPSFAALRLPAAIALVALFFGTLTALILRRRGNNVEATTSIAFAMALSLVAAHIAYARFEPLLSSYPMAKIVNGLRQPGDELVVYGDQANASSLIFYTHMQALLINGRSSSMIWGSCYPDVPHIFLQDPDLIQLWADADTTHKRIFLYVPPEDEQHVRTLLGTGRVYRLMELSNGILVSNRPM